MAKNISIVYLLNVPLEDDLKNTLYFANSSAQHTYFENNIGKSYTNVSYQAEDRTFRCPDQLDTVRQYNYIMWQNTAYSNKWFYAFIKEAKYVSDGYTDIIFEVDPLQTFMFDITVMPSFVEREHTNDDTVGNNTLPENVELGEYVKNYSVATPQIGPNEMWYAVGVSEIIGTIKDDNTHNAVTPASNINGLPNGLYYVFTDSMSILHSIVGIYDNAGKANALYTMFSFPKQMLYTNQWNYKSCDWDYSNGGYTALFDIYIPTTNSVPGQLATYTINSPTKVGKTYYPRNNKLLTFPYCYFNISNNSGTTVTYRFEDFDGNPQFKLEGVLNVGCSTKLYPINYKNMDTFTGEYQDNSYDYGITGGKYPTISWNSDSYTNWLTQNAVNIGTNLATTALATVANVATGNVIGAGATLASGISNAVGQVYQASLMPDQSRGNTNVGDLNYTAHKNKFTVFPLSIKPEYAAIIDDYFDLLGYATNRVKIPNVAHRQNWWYTKTINANIVGNVPNNYMNKIKDAYNNGLTFWRNPSNFLNYSVSNGIV